jgi:predicted Zn-dependent peptidase
MRVDRSRLPVPGPASTFVFPLIVNHALPNGLTVKTVEHHGVPLVILVLQIAGGSSADTPGSEGLVAATADMVDEGTGELTAIDISDALARIGAEYEVGIGPDATTIALTTLVRFADRGAALLSDMVTSPSLREDDFQRVRQLRLDRLRQLNDSAPVVADRTFLELIYGAHPYSHLAIGRSESLRRLRLADVAALHTSLFRPSGATLVVAGDMTHEDLFKTAETAFSGWMEGDGLAVRRIAASDIDPVRHSASSLAVVRRERAAQSELRLGHLSARRDTPDYSSLLVMNAVLGGQFMSRINLKLREEKGYTYGARTGFDWRRGLSPFSVQTSVETKATADAIRDSVNEIAAIRDTRPPSEGELELAKASLTRGYPRNFETARQVAHSVAQLALYGLPDSYFEQFVPGVEAVRADDVVRVARQYLDPRRMTNLVVGDLEVIRESLEGLGLGEPRVIEAEP